MPETPAPLPRAASENVRGAFIAIDDSLASDVRRLQAGDEAREAYRRLDDRLRPRLLAYFRAHGFAVADAEDLVQKALLRVYAGVKKLSRPESFLAWLFTIARNLRLSALEAKRRERGRIGGGSEALDGLVDPTAGADPPLDGELERERIDALRRAMADLPPQQRQCLLLRARDGLAYEDIAAAMALSVNTVRNHLAAARRSLRRRLEAYFGEDAAR
jgi:RNA polymerase sigma-70 factor (ECF subfamily)